MTRLTYVIPAFNAESTLDQTVRSVLEQTERAVEVVIVDDGSEDGTRQLSGALLGPRVRLVVQQNRGLAGARNTGWRSVESPFVCFLDADDVVHPTHAARMLEAIGEADAVACSYEFVGPRLESLGWRAPVLPSDTTHARLIEVNRLAVGGVVLRHERVLNLLRGARFDGSLPVHEDWDLFLRLASAGVVWAPPIDEPLFRYRLSGSSLSTKLEWMWRVGVRVIETHAADEVERVMCLRRWHVRAVARAIAVGSEGDLRAALDAVGALRDEDMPTLVGTLRWSLARAEFVGPRGWASRMPAWTERVRSMMPDEAITPAIMQRLAFGPHRWRDLVERARALLSPGQPLVVYGFGRNGREAVRAATEAGLSVAVVDDDASVIGKVPAMSAEDLTPEHVVLVTPEDRERILARLRDRGVSRIVLPDAA